MKQIFYKIISLPLIVILFASTSPYFLPLFISLHGSHSFNSSFDGKALRVTLHHSGADHSHEDLDNNHSDHHHQNDSSGKTKDHEVKVGIFNFAKTSSEIRLDVPTILTVRHPSVFSSLISINQLEHSEVFKLEKLIKPPNFHTCHQTIVLHI